MKFDTTFQTNIFLSLHILIYLLVVDISRTILFLFAALLKKKILKKYLKF